MKPRTIQYYFREAFRSVVINRLMSVASIFTVASCIFIVSVFYTLGANVELFIQQLGENVELAVSIEDALDPVEKLRLEGLILAIPQVSGIRYETRDEALENIRERLGDMAVQGMELDNPLPDSFIIQLVDLAYQDDVIVALEGLRADGVANIRYSADVVDILIGLSTAVNLISLSLVLVLGLISVIIITNTIRITVNARRTEINIMKYVGATDWFIRWPFIIEGLIIGLLGGAIPSAIVIFGYDRAVEFLREILGIEFIVFMPGEEILPTLIPLALLLGAVIGLVGSSVSVRRHLQV